MEKVRASLNTCWLRVVLCLYAVVFCAGCAAFGTEPDTVEVVVHEFRTTPEDIIQAFGQPHVRVKLPETSSPYSREILTYNISRLPFTMHITFCDRNGVCAERGVDKKAPWWERKFVFYDGVYAKTWRSLKDYREAEKY